ncbi:MAG: amidohydrolase family protein [Nitrososphaerales archaeon]
MKIDIFCHIYTRKLLDEYVKTQLPLVLRFGGFQVPAEETRFVDADARLKVMDKYGIDIQVLTIAFQNAITTVPDKDLLRISRIANDSLAELVDESPERLIGIATLLNPSGEGLDELDHAIKDLGMKGCLVFSNVKGRPLDSPEFIPFYERMAKYDLPIFIHPTDWTYYNWVGDYRLDRIFGWPFDTSLALGRLVFGGVMPRFPNLKIIGHHLGGMTPYFSGRILEFIQQAVSHPGWAGAGMFPDHVKGQEGRKHDDPLKYFRSFYGDTVIMGNASAVRCAIDFFGVDHILYATDYPFGADNGEENIRLNTSCVEDLHLSAEDNEKIFEKNARRLLKLR